MKVLNFGSLNYDHVYRVPYIANPGETVSATRLEVFCGGKGLNQSVALRRAGLEVFHAGFVGPDGDTLIQVCRDNDIDPRFILSVFEQTGNSVIQVDEDGQNSIVMFPGANYANSPAYVDSVLAEFEAGDVILLQNEINCVDHIIRQAAARGMRIFFNPSPFNRSVLACDLTKVDTFLINELEGEQITGEKDPVGILDVMAANYPGASVVLTLGGQGAACLTDGQVYRHGVYDVAVVDTTAAGDTFTGHFLAAILAEKSPEEALRLASMAASITVSREGASISIPTLEEVLAANLHP